MQRATWNSRIGFILTAAGSAIGLANIVRFPYLVANNGGLVFIAAYLFFLLIIGLPIFNMEILLGKHTRLNPVGAFWQIGQNLFWKAGGKLIVITGLIISSFYSVIAGWILWYLITAIMGKFSSFSEITQFTKYHQLLLHSPYLGIICHGAFLSLCALLLYKEIHKGLERYCSFLLPCLFLLLIYLVFFAVNLPNAEVGITKLFSFNWQELTPTVMLLALGQAFFTLSVGQGTMITYGSYLSTRVNILSNCLIIAIADTVVSILIAVVIFAIAFSSKLEFAAGLNLMFDSLPFMFMQLSGGYWLAIIFFLLVAIAAITSEISALEPAIAYLIDRSGFSRKKATLLCCIAAFTLGVPSALSYSWLSNISLLDKPVLEVVDLISTAILIPLGGLLAVILVAWKWGINNAISALDALSAGLINRSVWLKPYLIVCVKYLAPLMIIVVAIRAFIS